MPTPEDKPTIRLAELCKTADGGGGVISEWIGDGVARADMRARVVHLRRIPRTEWDIKHFRPLTIKKTKGIFELKWKSEGKEFRAGGYDHSEGYFVMLLGFTHKEGVYVPPGWKEIIRTRRREVDERHWKIIEFEP